LAPKSTVPLNTTDGYQLTLQALDSFYNLIGLAGFKVGNDRYKNGFIDLEKYQKIDQKNHQNHKIDQQNKNNEKNINKNNEFKFPRVEKCFLCPNNDNTLGYSNIDLKNLYRHLMLFEEDLDDQKCPRNCEYSEQKMTQIRLNKNKAKIIKKLKNLNKNSDNVIDSINGLRGIFSEPHFGISLELPNELPLSDLSFDNIMNKFSFQYPKIFVKQKNEQICEENFEENLDEIDFKKFFEKKNVSIFSKKSPKKSPKRSQKSPKNASKKRPQPPSERPQMPQYGYPLYSATNKLPDHLIRSKMALKSKIIIPCIKNLNSLQVYPDFEQIFFYN